MVRLAIFFLCLAVVAHGKTCADGEHPEIPIKDIQIQYSGLIMQGRFEGLARLGIDAKTIQTATQETQEYNQYLQAIAIGYNSCAITKAQYSEYLQKISPVKQNITSIQLILKQVQTGQKNYEKLEALMKRYLGSLQGVLKDRDNLRHAPAHNDPQTELLDRATKLIINVCNFYQDWETTQSNERTRATTVSPDGKKTLDLEQYRFFYAIHDQEEAPIYQRIFQSDVDGLRDDLMREVPGATTTDITRLSRPKHLGEMQMNYDNLYSLRAALEQKITTGQYTKHLDEKRTGPRICPPNSPGH